MNTSEKGLLAVLKVEQRAIEKGWATSRPSQDLLYDLVLDDGGRLHRAQVKYADGKSSHSSGVVVASLGRRKGSNPQPNFRYPKGCLDVLLVYVPRIDKVLWFGTSVFEGVRNLSIRLEPPMNGQKTRINLAEDFIW